MSVFSGARCECAFGSYKKWFFVKAVNCFGICDSCRTIFSLDDVAFGRKIAPPPAMEMPISKSHRLRRWNNVKFKIASPPAIAQRLFQNRIAFGDGNVYFKIASPSAMKLLRLA